MRWAVLKARTGRVPSEAFTAKALAEKVKAVITADQPSVSVAPELLVPDDTAHPA
jgi:hypothetical protein